MRFILFAVFFLSFLSSLQCFAVQTKITVLTKIPVKTVLSERLAKYLISETADGKLLSRFFIGRIAQTRKDFDELALAFKLKKSRPFFVALQARLEEIELRFRYLKWIAIENPRHNTMQDFQTYLSENEIKPILRLSQIDKAIIQDYQDSELSQENNLRLKTERRFFLGSKGKFTTLSVTGFPGSYVYKILEPQITSPGKFKRQLKLKQCSTLLNANQ